MNDDAVIQPQEVELPPGSEVAPDRFLIWPLIVTIGAPLVAGSLISMAPALFLPILALWLLVWSSGTLAALVVAGFALWKVRWRRAASMLVLPISIGIFAVELSLSIAMVNYFGDYIHFLIVRGSYEMQVAALPRGKEPRFLRFEWGGFLGNFVEVIYDEVDQLALPEGQQSAEWLDRARGGFGVCEFKARPLGEHFYVVNFSC